MNRRRKLVSRSLREINESCPDVAAPSFRTNHCLREEWMTQLLGVEPTVRTDTLAIVLMAPRFKLRTCSRHF